RHGTGAASPTGDRRSVSARPAQPRGGGGSGDPARGRGVARAVPCPAGEVPPETGGPGELDRRREGRAALLVGRGSAERTARRHRALAGGGASRPGTAGRTGSPDRAPRVRAGERGPGGPCELVQLIPCPTTAPVVVGPCPGRGVVRRPSPANSRPH